MTPFAVFQHFAFWAFSRFDAGGDDDDDLDGVDNAGEYVDDVMTAPFLNDHLQVTFSPSDVSKHPYIVQGLVCLVKLSHPKVLFEIVIVEHSLITGEVAILPRHRLCHTDWRKD